LRVERTATVMLVRVPPEIGIVATLVEQRRKVRLQFGSEEIPVARPPRERKAKRAAERRAPIGSVRIRRLVPSATPDRQPARLGDRLDESGLAGAVLPDETRHRLPEFEIEIADERDVVRKLLEIRYALGEEADALEQQSAACRA